MDIHSEENRFALNFIEKCNVSTYLMGLSFLVTECARLMPE